MVHQAKKAKLNPAGSARSLASPSSTPHKPASNDILTLSDNSDQEMDSEGGSEDEFEYDDELIIDEAVNSSIETGPEIITLSQEHTPPPSPPPGVGVPKGKGSSRKIYQQDLATLIGLYSSPTEAQVFSQSPPSQARSSSDQPKTLLNLWFLAQI